MLANSASANANANQYQGTLDETGVERAQDVDRALETTADPAPTGAERSPGALTVQNASHDRSNLRGQQGRDLHRDGHGGRLSFDLSGPGNTVTMNGDVTLDGTSGPGTIAGSGTFQSAAACAPANCVGDLLIHDGQFAGPRRPRPSRSPTARRPSSRTTTRSLEPQVQLQRRRRPADRLAGDHHLGGSERRPDHHHRLDRSC